MKTILKRIFRSQGGFTLIELLAVLAIISVLAGIVTAAVSGTKGTSIESQVKSDGSATASATDNYNTSSLTGAFPDQAISSSIRYQSTFDIGLRGGVGVTLLDSQGNQIGSGVTLASVIRSTTGQAVLGRSAIDFAATTEAYQKDGSIGSSTYVPDYLAKEPSSLVLEGAASRGLDDNFVPEFLWLYAVVSPSSERENRRTEVYRLQTATCVTTLPLSTATALTNTNATTPITVGSLTGDVTGAKSALGEALTTLATKQKEFDSAEQAVKAARAKLEKALQTLKADSTGVINAANTVTDAENALQDARVALVTAQLDVFGGAGVTVPAVTTTAPGVTAGNPAVPVSGVTVGKIKAVEDAIAALTREQDAQTGAAISAGAACSGSSKVMNLTYKRIF